MDHVICSGQNIFHFLYKNSGMDPRILKRFPSPKFYLSYQEFPKKSINWSFLHMYLLKINYLLTY